MIVCSVALMLVCWAFSSSDPALADARGDNAHAPDGVVSAVPAVLYRGFVVGLAADGGEAE